MAALSSIALIMTVGVYGLVAGIVKLDDAGLYLSQRHGAGVWHQLLLSMGNALVYAAPGLMRSLSIIGTAAMFLVGGGILTHGIPALHHGIERLAGTVGAFPGIGGVVQWLAPSLLNALAGIVAGAVVLLGVSVVGRVWRASNKSGPGSI